VQDVSEKEVTEARSTTEYNESNDAMSKALGKAPRNQTVKACRSLLEMKKYMVTPRDVGNRTGKPIGIQARDRGEIVPSKNLKLVDFGFYVSGAQLHFVAFFPIISLDKAGN
jgi:hypothetical protein